MKQLLLLCSLLCAPLMQVALAQQQLTLRVNMSGQTVSPNGVHVAGSFQSEAGFGGDWLPSATPLTDADNDNIYEATISVPAGLYHYKFVNGNSWADPAETSLSGCGTDDGSGNFNREVSVGTTNLRLPIVAFGGCNPQLSLSVNMGQQTVSASGVHVTGNFQALAGYGSDWLPNATPMHDTDGDGIYTLRLSLPAQGIYEYKYLNGTSWDAAELVPAACGKDDGSGNFNREIQALSAITNAPVYCFGSCDVCGNATTPPPTDYTTHWWNDAVFYEVFVRSFYDSNGNGKGDFKGLTQKLDYLNDGNPDTNSDLGITGIWLMPMMESPSYHGYDVTNYKATEPDYGSMADFEAFLAAAHARGIKVIIDFVMNHSSSQHTWFNQSGNPASPYRNWYRWSDTNPGTQGLGGNAWHYKDGQYYYGIFWDGMPDLNWDSPELKAEMWDVTRFWLNKGVDGYRIDAVKYLDEDGATLENTPGTFSLLEEFNQVVKSVDATAFTVGEVWSSTASIVPYVENNRLDVCFEFELATAITESVNGNNPAAVRSKLDHVSRAYPTLQYATFLSNHDQNRIFNVLNLNMAHMKQAAALYLTMPGVPFLYYGEEVGMLGVKPDEDIRRPMQWTSGSKAGFTTGTPWRSINSNFATYNVQSMATDPNSLLNHYKKLIGLRNSYAPLRKGYYLPVEASNTNLLSYARVWEQEAVMVVSNFSAEATSNPALTLAISTLQAGTYQATELYSGQSLGAVTVDEKGAISSWAPGSTSLAADHTWVILISQNPYVPTAPIVPTAPTGLPAGQDLLSLHLYPNPSPDFVHIELKENKAYTNQVQVFDMSGKLLQELSFTGSKHRLDTRSWANGTYFLRIHSGSTNTIKRLIVAH